MPELARRARRFVVNGRPLRIVWDIEHNVHDADGRPVLGVCEHDPDAPDTVMISLSGPRLAGRPATFRSTAVHELGHALFDMPAVLGSRPHRIVRAVVDEWRISAPAGRLGKPRSSRTPDWSEWRVGVFMGAFMAPLDRLASAVARQAGALDMPLRWHAGPKGLPIPTIAADAEAELIDCFVEQLANSFGVSPAFMPVRLHKGGFVPPHVVTFAGRS